jgi:hypothetical protein
MATSPAPNEPIARPPIPAVTAGRARLISPATLMGVMLASGIASAFGFLEGHGAHPDLKLGGAMLLSVGGTAIVLSVRYLALGSDPTAPSFSGSRQTASQVATTLLSVFTPLVAALSMASALIHFAVIEQHFTEYWLYGTFFIAVGLFQAFTAVLLLTRPSRLLYVAVIAGNLATAAAWVITRTVGLFVGPAAHETEAIGFGDLVSTIFEVLIVVGLLILFRRSWAGRRFRTAPAEASVVLIALAITTVTILGLFSSVGGSPFVSHVG